MKLIIFGIGQFYQNREKELEKLCNGSEVICFFDNKVDDTGCYKGKRLSKPFRISDSSFDKIILMSRKSKEMREQLLSIGYYNNDIWTWNEFISEMLRGKFELYCGSDRKKECNRRILLITHNLGYSGGAVAIANAAKILAVDNDVLLAAPVGDTKFINELQSEGINILIFKAFPYIAREEEYLFNSFDIAIVNVFPMLPVAVRLSKSMPVLWWIHEAKEWYKPTIEEYEEMAQKELFSDMNIMAVSSIAKNNFNQYFDNTIKNILAYGIPDLYRHESVCNYKKDKMIFAIVGVVTYRKAQDIFVDAIDILQKRNKISNTEFWIIGAIEDNQFCREIIESSKKSHNIIIKGQMTRIEIQEAFKKIDVVVCPSREDPLPIVMTEGMMYGKVCIASDETGTFDFIEEKVNGLVCESENSISLADAMEWVIDNRDKCSNIGVNARKTYEDYFTMENFGDRLNRAIDITLTKLRSR